MNEYRKSSHSIFDIKLHVAWITKYRKPVLMNDIAERVRELIKRICKEQKVEIISGAVSKDHIHMLISIDPSVKVSKLMQLIKGKTSHKLQMEYPSLKREYWGRRFWARGYFCVSVGNTTEKLVKEYIEHHFEGKEGSDSFRIAS